MIKNKKQFYNGFTIVEVIVYIAIFSIIFLTITGVAFWFNYSSLKSKADKETLDSANAAMETMLYEIRRAESIYVPTTTVNQLSLKTYYYGAEDENMSYIDFFLCGARICFKKESQPALYITPHTVKVDDLTFTQIATNGAGSIKIDMTVKYNTTDPKFESSVNLSSTASLRSY